MCLGQKGVGNAPDSLGSLTRSLVLSISIGYDFDYFRLKEKQSGAHMVWLNL